VQCKNVAGDRSKRASFVTFASNVSFISPRRRSCGIVRVRGYPLEGYLQVSAVKVRRQEGEDEAQAGSTGLQQEEAVR
jgi:hypothetical protein